MPPETTQPRIEQALDVVERERTYLAAELTAFERFRARIAAVDPTPQSSEAAAASAGGVTALATRQPAPDTGLRTVRQAYRETVMAVPHYEAEYDDALEANMAAEFGPELATQIATGSRLPPNLYEALLAATEGARDERETLLPALERERESLESVRERLDDCERRAAALGTNARRTADGARLATIDDQLATVERECEQVATTRQQRLHSRSAAALSGIDGTSLVRYLYADCPVTCPALADTVACLETIHRHRKHCLVTTT